MRKLNILFILILLTGFFSALYADENKDFIDKSLFVKDVREAVTGGESSVLIEKTAPYLKEMERSHIPNCFECSLFLINSTIQSLPDVQLVAADLAVKFSPDLPEARLHFLSRLIRFAPFKVDKITSESGKMMISFFKFPPRDAFFYSILDIVANICLVFILSYFFIIFLKYPSLIVHRFTHLSGSSKFYAGSLLMVIGVSSWILIKNEQNQALVILTFLVFLSGVSLLREKIVLYVAYVIMVAAQGGIILAGANEDSNIDRIKAMNNLYAVYSPISADIKNIDDSMPGGSMARGFKLFYDGNQSRAVFHLKKELNGISDNLIKISLENLAGLSLAATGNYKEAVPYLKNAYEESLDVHIGYNLAKVMYEGGMTEEASRFEKDLLESAGAVTLFYPHIYLPPMYKMWRFVSSGRTSDRFENRVRFAVFILSILFFYILLLLVRLNYLKGLSLTRCLECGTVMCSRCNAGGQHVCAVCRLMKAKPDIFARGEKTKYEVKRERFFARHSFYTTLFNFIFPGGGLIFSNKVLEGSTYLFLTILMVMLFLQKDSGLIFNISTGESNIFPFFVIAAVALTYLLSIVRGFIVSRGD